LAFVKSSHAGPRAGVRGVWVAIAGVLRACGSIRARFAGALVCIVEANRAVDPWGTLQNTVNLLRNVLSQFYADYLSKLLAT
jgi:hypothetical protein